MRGESDEDECVKRGRAQRMLLALGVLAALLLTWEVTVAQSGPNYNLNWWTVNGGGGEVGGGGYTLLGTAGQPDVGAALTGGGYWLIGGFWPGSKSIRNRLVL